MSYPDWIDKRDIWFSGSKIPPDKFGRVWKFKERKNDPLKFVPGEDMK